MLDFLNGGGAKIGHETFPFRFAKELMVEIGKQGLTEKDSGKKAVLEERKEMLSKSISEQAKAEAKQEAEEKEMEMMQRAMKQALLHQSDPMA
jgi:hypothetical protein